MASNSRPGIDNFDDVQNQYYRYLLDCSSYAVIGTDCQGITVSWNRAAQRMFSLERSAMLGRHIEQIVPQEHRRELYQAIEQVIAERRTVEFEVEHHHQDGNVMTLGVVITSVMDGRDQVLGMAVWICDITKQKKLERKLVHAEKMASLGTLASGVAHHFNNIIGGVATFVDFALTTGDPDSGRRALEMTAEAAGRISHITSSLLTFARKDLREFDLCDLTEVVMTFAHLVEKPLARKKIKLELNLGAIPVLEVPGPRMQQLLSNLLDNAERAMSDGGTITISLDRRADLLVLTFADTGTGIIPSVLPHIFEPFFTTLGTHGGGNQASAGLGLSVVHGIMQELNGTIEVNSQPNRGTTFEMCFPNSDRPRRDIHEPG